jgi:hypothetical protein
MQSGGVYEHICYLATLRDYYSPYVGYVIFTDNA